MPSIGPFEERRGRGRGHEMSEGPQRRCYPGSEQKRNVNQKPLVVYIVTI